MKLAFSKPTGTAEETRELFTTFGAYGFDGLQLKPGQYSPYFGRRSSSRIGGHIRDRRRE